MTSSRFVEESSSMRQAQCPLADGHCIGRRQFLSDLGMGFTGAVLGAMLFEDGIARALPTPTAPELPAFPARAKSVIWLFMLGGASHIETFDPKPVLHKYAGMTIGETPYAGVLQASQLNK